MTHKPPVPAASQSPYPLHPPAVPRQRWAMPVRATPRPIMEKRSRHAGRLIIGIGTAAVATLILFLRRR